MMFQRLAFVFLLSRLALAHMQLKKPLPFKSTYDPANGQNVDYSMTAPLNSDGSNYPCKGYHTAFDSTPAKDILVAGQSYTFELAGTATHNGGSGQIALSYDKGENFIVIHSLMGGHPLKSSYTFTVPKNTPAAEKVLLQWSWMNRTGNREFYQNCSPVKVTNSNANAVLTAPALYRANSFADGTCIVPEGTDVVFPNPGESVEYGGAYAGSKPTSATQLANCPYNNNKSLTVKGNGSVSDDAPPPPTEPESPAPSVKEPVSSATSTTKTDQPAQPTYNTAPPAASTPSRNDQPAPDAPVETPKSSSAVVSSRAPVQPSSTPVVISSPPSKPSPVAGKCSNGDIKCTGSGKTFSSCWDNTWIDAGKVAAGTICKNGAIVGDVPDPVCVDSTIRCDSKMTWSLCSNGAYIKMGSTAGGVNCIDGKMVSAAGLKRHTARRIARNAVQIIA